MLVIRSQRTTRSQLSVLIHELEFTRRRSVREWNFGTAGGIEVRAPPLSVERHLLGERRDHEKKS
jgi:hypothetical protein